MCFLMFNRCRGLIITPITAGRCWKTASSSRLRTTLCLFTFVCVHAVTVCVHSMCVYACTCTCICVRTCMDFFCGLYLHSCVGVFVCACIWHGSNFKLHFYFTLLQLPLTQLHTQNNMIIHDILGTWKWKTIYLPQLFPLIPLSSFNFTSISRCDSPVPEVRICVKCVSNANGVRKRRVALSLCVALSHSSCVEWLRHALWPCPSIIDGTRCQRAHTPNTTEYHTHRWSRVW